MAGGSSAEGILFSVLFFCLLKFYNGNKMKTFQKMSLWFVIVSFLGFFADIVYAEDFRIDFLLPVDPNTPAHLIEPQYLRMVSLDADSVRKGDCDLLKDAEFMAVQFGDPVDRELIALINEEIKRLSHLSKFGIYGMKEEDTLNVIKAISESNSKVTLFIFMNYNDLSVSIARSLNQLKHLTKLEIDGCDNIQSGFIKGLSSLKGLDELRIIGCFENESNYSVICKNLEYLDNIKSLYIEEGYIEIEEKNSDGWGLHKSGGNFENDYLPLVQAINKLKHLERLSLERLAISPEVLTQLSNKNIWKLTFTNPYWPLDLASLTNLQGLQVLNLDSGCVDKPFTVDPEKLPNLTEVHWKIRKVPGNEKSSTDMP